MARNRQERLDSVKAEFRAEPPDAVVIRSVDMPLFADVMAQPRPVVAETFELDREVGPFQVWRPRLVASTG